MKKILSAIICVVVLIGCIPINTFAVGEISPYYNNTQRTTTNFTISDSGVAKVRISYNGYKDTTTGATIKTKIQKSFLFFFWSDVTSWTDEASGYYYSTTHSTSVDSGTYRAIVEYTIRGTGGSADVITEQLEYSY